MAHSIPTPRLARLLAVALVTALLALALPVRATAPPRSADPVQWARQLDLLDDSFQPDAPITRAQLASMLTRLLDVKAEAPLDGFTDVGSGAWYDPIMAQAVAMGMLKGDNQNRLQPTAQLTRQDAAVLLGRTLGIAGGDPAVLRGYTDAAAVRDYAAPYLAAMVSSGYLKGTTSKTLSPAAVMTQRQAVGLLYQTVQAVCTDRAAAEAAPDGFVLLRGVPASGLVHAGDLLLDVGDAEVLDLRPVTVTGRLIVRSSAPLLTVRVARDVQAGQLVFCTPASVTLEGDQTAVSLLASGSAIKGNGGRLYVEGAADCDGAWAQMDVRADGVRLTGGPVDQLSIYSGKAMRLDTRAAHADLYAPGFVLGGDGYVDEVWFHGPGMEATCTVGQRICDYDAGLTGVTLRPKAVTATAGTPKVEVQFTVSGVDSQSVFGVPGGVRTVTATLYRGDTALQSRSDFLLKNGAVLSFPVTYTFTRYMAQTTDELRVVLRYQNQEVSAKTTVPLVNYADEHYAKLSGAKLPYYIEVVKNHNVVIVYGQDSAGRYSVPVKTFLCSTGKYTPLGSFTTSTKKRWGTLFANYEHTRFCYGQYVTTIYKDYLFHSVPYFTPNVNDLEYAEYNKLGTTASMGCIRLTVADVKWIYDNCPSGTKVTIRNYDQLPVTKPAAPYIDPNSPNRGWDPTDPDPANPWKQSK